MVSREAVVQIIYSTIKLDSLTSSVEEAADKIVDLNGSKQECTCYSTGYSSEGAFFLVRNDCPVHKGSLGR